MDVSPGRVKRIREFWGNQKSGYKASRGDDKSRSGNTPNGRGFGVGLSVSACGAGSTGGAGNVQRRFCRPGEKGFGRIQLGCGINGLCGRYWDRQCRRKPRWVWLRFRGCGGLARIGRPQQRGIKGELVKTEIVKAGIHFSTIPKEEAGVERTRGRYIDQQENTIRDAGKWASASEISWGERARRPPLCVRKKPTGESVSPDFLIAEIASGNSSEVRSGRKPLMLGNPGGWIEASKRPVSDRETLDVGACSQC